MPILVAPSRFTPDPTPAAVKGLSIYWHGWDGSTWNIGDDPTSGVRLMAGFRGLLFPEITQYSDQFAGVDGSSDRGFRVEEREMFWPIRVYTGDKSQEWLDYHDAFMETMQPGKSGVLEVVQPNGTASRITLKLKSDGSPAYDTDPALTGRYTYGFLMRAPQPMFERDPISVTFSPPATGDFFGPDRFISSSFSFAQASITNPGKVSAWPVWEIQGPASTISVGVGGGVVTYPVTLLATDRLVIDTNPTAQTAKKNGVTVTPSLTSRDFRPVPAGSSVPLSVSLTASGEGAGTVTVTITPRYYRAI